MLTIPGKIPITVHPFFWVLIFLLGWINSEAIHLTLIWAAIIFVSVLGHEFGHALTAVLFGQRAKIDLVALGGLTSRTGKTTSLWQDFLIVMNGPLFGFILYFLFSYLLTLTSRQQHPYLSYAFAVGSLVNFWWTILNLIPIQPMDGGKLLSIFLESILGLKGVKIALFISMLLAGALAAFFFATGNLFMGAIILMFLVESYRNWRATLSITEWDRDKEMQELYSEAERDANFGYEADAEEKLKQIREQTKKGFLYTGATQNLAALYAKQEKVDQAIALLESIEGKLLPDQLIQLQALYYKAGNFKKAAAVGIKAYQLAPTGDAAFANALTYAKLGELKPTLGWLQAALRDGKKDLKQALQRPEFNAFRNDPQFGELLKQV